MVLPSAPDRLAFEAFVIQLLVPTLRPGHIVVLDTLSAHKSARVAEAIAARGGELWFLPSYSPDFSPIEQAFATLKNAWRQAEARTPEALLEAIATSLPSITPADARSCFYDCGYHVAPPLVQSL